MKYLLPVILFFLILPTFTALDFYDGDIAQLNSTAVELVKANDGTFSDLSSMLQLGAGIAGFVAMLLFGGNVKNIIGNKMYEFLVVGVFMYSLWQGTQVLQALGMLNIEIMGIPIVNGIYLGMVIVLLWAYLFFKKD